MENTIQPSFKAPQMDSALTSLFGVDRKQTISDGECIACDAEGIIASSFSNDISKKEYSISGMCQSCQDELFGPDEEEEDEPEGFDDFEPREDFGYFGEAGLWD